MNFVKFTDFLVQRFRIRAWLAEKSDYCESMMGWWITDENQAERSWIDGFMTLLRIYSELIIILIPPACSTIWGRISTMFLRSWFRTPDTRLATRIGTRLPKASKDGGSQEDLHLEYTDGYGLHVWLSRCMSHGISPYCELLAINPTLSSMSKCLMSVNPLEQWSTIVSKDRAGICVYMINNYWPF